MERTETEATNADGQRRRRRTRRAEEPLSGPTYTMAVARPPAMISSARLAAVAVELNVRLRSADMPAAMQERAFRCTRALLDAASPNSKRLNPTQLALSLKKEFDGVYGPAWHCVVGKSFGSFVTHSSGGFVYFSVDKLSFLLFKTQVRPVKTATLR